MLLNWEPKRAKIKLKCIGVDLSTAKHGRKVVLDLHGLTTSTTIDYNLYDRVWNETFTSPKNQ